MPPKETKRIIVYDLDNTLYENTWERFNQLMGVTQEEDTNLYEKRKENTINQQEWLNSLYNIYSKDQSKLKREYLLSLVNSLHKKDGSDDIIKYLKDKGYKQYLLSGGLDIITNSIADRLGITFLGASIGAVFDQNDVLTGFKTVPSESEFKLTQVIQLKESLSCNPEDIICLGDGDNEREIFKYTKRGITFTNSRIVDLAWKQINNISELKLIL